MLDFLATVAENDVTIAHTILLHQVVNQHMRHGQFQRHVYGIVCLDISVQIVSLVLNLKQTMLYLQMLIGHRDKRRVLGYATRGILCPPLPRHAKNPHHQVHQVMYSCLYPHQVHLKYDGLLQRMTFVFRCPFLNFK